MCRHQNFSDVVDGTGRRRNSILPCLYYCMSIRRIRVHTCTRCPPVDMGGVHIRLLVDRTSTLSSAGGQLATYLADLHAHADSLDLHRQRLRNIGVTRAGTATFARQNTPSYCTFVRNSLIDYGGYPNLPIVDDDRRGMDAEQGLENAYSGNLQAEAATTTTNLSGS